jgi:hypothetical protein
MTAPMLTSRLWNRAGQQAGTSSQTVRLRREVLAWAINVSCAHSSLTIT